jgi:meso-butanediol dehydrogenase / (S,S)-butanediol dehydrogenase / diacetyl reductase
MGRLKDKITLITGAGSGMGRATALRFAREEAKVAVVDWIEKSAQETARQIKAEGGDAIAIHADVSKSADASRMVSQTVARWGRLDIIYNNAGIGPACLLHEMSEEEWDLCLDVNLKGVFLGCKYALPELMKHGGVILSTASISGVEGTNGIAHYCASKAGIIALTKVVAMDYAKYGIRANCICPGGIDTAMAKSHMPDDPAVAAEFQKFVNNLHPLNRMGRPEEIAATALFLCSDEASFITGQSVIVDGGWMAGHKLEFPEITGTKRI